MNIERLRAETPGCADYIHLNNAGASLMPEPVARAIHDHLTHETRIGGYEAEALREDAIQDAYRSVADLIGARPSNVAFTENATASFALALSAVPWARGDVIATTRNDYASNQIQYLSLQSRLGVEVVRARDAESGGVDLDDMAALIARRQPKVVCVTHVPTNSGLVQDVAAIGALCRDADVLYLVDACQSVGQMPIDVAAIGCDFLSATARKFLRGPRGTGFLYVSDRVLERGMEPLYIDMRGADWISEGRYQPVADAKRFENWEFNWALVLGMGAAARYASAIGLEPIRDRARALATRLREHLADVPRVRVLDRGREQGAIVSIAVDGADTKELSRRLRERHINTTAQIRIYAVLDYDAKGVAASLRLSPHYYNTEDEIDHTVSVLRDLITG